MKQVIRCLAILTFTVPPAHAGRFTAGPLELTVTPASAVGSAQTYRLLPAADQQTDTDAVPWYEKAVQAMPRGRVQDEQVRQWLALAPEQLPQSQVEEVIKKHTESLILLAQAVNCKECNWPKWKPGTMPPDQSEYRGLASLLRLQARLAVVQGEYDKALKAMQTGFGLARHIGQGPTCTQAMVGAALGGAMGMEVEGFIEGKDAPNLYRALASLPRPLVDVENAITSDMANLKNYNFLMRRAFEKQMKPSHDRIRLIAKRLDTHLNALQCIEAIRRYAATRDRQLPLALNEIRDLELPTDLMNGKAFDYRRTDKGAVLQSGVPAQGDEGDVVRYEIILKEK